MATPKHNPELLRETIAAREKTPAGAERPEGDEHFKVIVDNIKDSVLIETVDGSITYANRAGCRMLGYSREELLGLKVSDIVPAHIARTLPSKITEDSLAEGNYIESEQLLKDGRRIPVEVSASLVEIGGKKRVVAILRDITDRKLAEAIEDLRAAKDELQARVDEQTADLARSRDLLRRETAGRKLVEKNLSDSEERYRELFNISPEGIMLLDLQGNIIIGNDRVCGLYGYSRDELRRLSLKDIVPGQLDKNFPRLVDNLRKQGDLFFVSQGKKRDGSVFPAELSVALYSRKGEDFVQVMVRDVTEREEFKRALEAGKNRLRSIIENSVDGIMIIDRGGRVRFVNPATERLFDRKADDFIGEYFSIPLTGGETAEIVVERPDRRQLTVEIGVSEIRWEGESAFLASLRDVTARKELEKLKDDFIDTVSHEMRNPLAVLRVGIGQVRDEMSGPVNNDQREILSLTLLEIDRLSRLVNNLLNLSKIETGRMPFTRRLIDLNLVVAESAEKFRRAAGEKGLRLTVTVADGPLILYADDDLLRQVLTNLLENSLKFTPAGGEISVLAAKTEDAGVECSVADTGVGIEEKDREWVFEKFAYRPGSGSDVGQGSGLGLAITRELVELHGGRIWVESEPGRGSRFTFRIPDHLSEQSLTAYLDGLLSGPAGEHKRVGLLGFRLENRDELRRDWGEEVFSSFSRQFHQRLAVLIRKAFGSMPHCWLLEDSPGFTAVLKGARPDEIRRAHGNTLRMLKKLRFHRSGKILEFELRSAWVAAGVSAGSGRGMVDALRQRLKENMALTSRTGSRGKVLIVDDDRAVVKLLESFLREEDIETESAFDGEQALVAAARSPMDLIILDLELPKLNGYEVINRLRKNQETFDIPLILVSGYELDQIRLKKSGTSVMPVMLTKPFDFDQLRQAVDRKLAIEDIEL